MENAVIEKLAVEGLGDLTLSKADVESRGTNPAIVESACSCLEAESAQIDSLVSDMESTKTQLLASWEGESAAKFEANFPKLIQAFQQIPKCINLIATWAEEVKDAYVKIDQGSF